MLCINSMIKSSVRKPPCAQACRRFMSRAGLYAGRGRHPFNTVIDGGAWISLPADYRSDVAAATNAFDDDVDISGLSSGSHTMLIRAGTYYQVVEITMDIG